MSSDTVVLEVVFLPLNAEENGPASEVWKVIDELSIPAGTRQALADNGFRVGILGDPVPAEIRRRLDEKRQQRELNVGGDPLGLAGHPRIHSRTGRRSTVLVTPAPLPEMSVLTVDASYAGGQTFRKAQAVMALRTFPEGDGRVRLEAVPEIEHGDATPQLVGREGMWQFNVERDRKVFEKLLVSAVLAPGQSLAIGCTSADAGLGGQFFGTAHRPQFNLLLVRLAQVQLDELFSPAELTPSLETSLEDRR